MGRFRLRAPPDIGGLIVLARRVGFAPDSIPLERLVASPTILLRALPIVLTPITVDLADVLPPGWYRTGPPWSGRNYRIWLDHWTPHGGTTAICIDCAGDPSARFAAVGQPFRADSFVGKRVRLGGYVRVMQVQEWAGLWMRVDNRFPFPIAGTFDNMYDRPLRRDRDWEWHEVVLDVPRSAAAITIGVLINGRGRVCIDDLTFTVVDRSVRTTGLGMPSRVVQREPRPSLPGAPLNLGVEP
jgi:hypothetical protein